MKDVSIASSFRSGEVVIEQVNWIVSENDFWVVGGLHGSGKTDLVLTAAGLQRATEGSVYIFGKEQGGRDENELLEERRRIGVVFENGGRMFRHLTVHENVALPLRYHENLNEADSLERIRSILEITGLVPFAQHTIASLSVAWQQRVGLARALVMQPELLLIDKPSIGARYIVWWQEFLGKLRDGALFPNRSTTIVLTTDDFRDWTNVGSHFALVKKKRWHVLGGKAEFANAQDELWRDLTGEVAI